MVKQKKENKIDKNYKIDKNQASITGAIFASIIVSAIMFGLMMHLIVVPMVEKTDAKVNAININYSKINKVDIQITEFYHDYEIFKLDLTQHLGEWQCKKYKRYFNNDCIKLMKTKNAFLINNTICVTLMGFEYPFIAKDISVPILNYSYLPQICEEWKYVKME